MPLLSGMIAQQVTNPALRARAEALGSSSL
jgi:hypothetical protein